MTPAAYPENLDRVLDQKGYTGLDVVFWVYSTLWFTRVSGEEGLAKGSFGAIQLYR